ncbi:MAG: AMP-binding protein [Actinobacteria bacterium]|nr:AMP-binding protein [Actinomycetota bacterium]
MTDTAPVEVAAVDAAGQPHATGSDASDLARVLTELAEADPDHCYVENVAGGTRVCFGDLLPAARTWAGRFEADRVGRGAGVLLDVEDPLAFAVAYIATIASGRCAIPVDPAAPTGDVARTVRRLAPVATITDRADAASTAFLRPLLIDAATGRPIDDAPDGGATGLPGGATGLAGGGTVRLSTSGSTGEPKTVELTESQLLYVARQVASHNGLTPADRGFNPLPLFHINAEVVGLLASLVAGATLVLDRRFHRAGFWATVAERRITWINAVPAILAILARDELPSRPEVLRFIRSASAALPAAIRQSIEQAMDVTVVESYGMTEAASQITATPLDAPPRAGSAGVPVGVELQIRDEKGKLLALDAVGHVWIKGPGVITSYVGGRAAERFDSDRWLDTGDLGRVDADGYVYLAGRADDVINRGGELVYPREIEEVLMADPRVLDAIAVGRPDDILGAVPVAYVIPREAPGEASAEEQLRSHLVDVCARELSRFKRPKELILVEDLPRAPTGKIRRAQVREDTAAAHAAAVDRDVDRAKRP